MIHQKRTASKTEEVQSMPKKNADMNQFDWLKRMVCPGGRRDGVRMLFCLFVGHSQRHSEADHRSGTYNFRTQLLEETN